MNQEVYYGLVKLLSTGRMPTTIEEKIEKEVRKIQKNYCYQNHQLYYHGGHQDHDLRRVIPRHQKNQLLRQTHDHPLSGHQGQERTHQQTSALYYWPRMESDIKEYVRTCEICQKRERKRGEAPLEPIKKGIKPFHQVGIDVVGPLPRTLTGKRYVVVAIDHFTKWVEARALEEADAQSIATFIHEDIITRHGVPKKITTDRGSEFINDFMKVMTSVYDIHHIKTTAYHPQGNGQVERTNRTLKDILSKYSIKQPGKWDHYLPSALFAIRVSKSATTKYSPFWLLHGYEPRQPFDQETTVAQDIPMEEYAQQEITRLQEIRSQAGKFIEKAQDRQKDYHDLHSHLVEPLKIGDLVLLYRNVVESSWSAKMEPKWEGPFYIKDTKGLTYRLRNLDGTIQPKTVHRNRLKLYHARPTHQTRLYVEVPPRQSNLALPDRNIHEGTQPGIHIRGSPHHRRAHPEQSRSQPGDQDLAGRLREGHREAPATSPQPNSPPMLRLREHHTSRRPGAPLVKTPTNRVVIHLPVLRRCPRSDPPPRRSQPRSDPETQQRRTSSPPGTSHSSLRTIC